MGSPEQLHGPRTEEEYLLVAGFVEDLDLEVAPGILLRHFLDVYPPDSPQRDRTEGSMYNWLHPNENLDGVRQAAHEKLGKELRAAVQFKIAEAKARKAAGL